MAKGKQTYIGGQAVLEGVMMRGKRSIATAVRDSEGKIQIEARYLPEKKRGFSSLPFVRGIFNLITSMKDGMGCLMRSAEVYADDEEEGEPGKFEKFLSEKFHLDLMDVVTTVSLLLGILLAVGLFLFLPQFLGGLIVRFTPLPQDSGWYYLIVGGIKLLIFLGYLCLMLLLKDMRRTFMYHGAEHKTIACFEAGKELTVENVRGCSRVHDRCGTTFLFLVLAVNILLFTLVGYLLGINSIENGVLQFAARIGTEIVLLPVVAGISYEILRLFAKVQGKWILPFKAPGLLLQLITTRPPTDDMMEVAIAAFLRVKEMDEDPSLPETKFQTREKLSVLLKETKEAFSKEQIDESDAEWIYSLCLGIPRSELKNDKIILPSEREKLETMIAERLTGRPLWYITGDVEFCNAIIKVDERALIPRPETEELAALAIEEVKKGRKKVLDVCTGSGCIAIAIAKETGEEVSAADLSEDALSLARENAEANGVQITLFQGDLLENVTGTYDLIVCNPPYIPTGFIPEMQREVREFEPHMALDGGADGLDFYRRMAQDAPSRLCEGGMLLFECGEGQAEEICALFEGKKIEIVKDLEGVERMVKIIC